MKKSKLFIALSMLFGLGLAGCGSKKSEPTPPPEPPAPTYTAESVAEDFNENISAYGLALEYDEAYEEYDLAVNFGESEDESEENLASASYTLASFLPDYMVVDLEIYGDPESEDYYDLFGDESYYHYLSFITPDEAVEALIISYVYSGLLISQIGIANVAE